MTLTTGETLTHEEAINLLKNGEDFIHSKFDLLRNEPLIVLSAMEFDGRALPKAGDEIKDNTNFMTQLVSQYGALLNWASDRLKDDKEVVIEAVKDDGNTLINASWRLREDKEVVLEAIKQNEKSFIWAGDDIKELVANRNPVEVLTTAIHLEKNGITVDPWVDVFELQSQFELSKKLQAELPKHDFKSNIEKLDKSKLDAVIAESKNSFKESEAKSNVVSIAEVKNEIAAEVQETPFANAPVRPQRRLKL